MKNISQQKNLMRKKNKKNKQYNINQRSFHFKDYLASNVRTKKLSAEHISEDRIYVLFFFFFCLIFIFSLKITLISVQETKSSLKNYSNSKFFSPLRRDIIDRNGILISRNILAYHAAVKPSLIKNKDRFILNVKLIFKDISSENLKKKLEKDKYFYLKKGLSEYEKKKLWALGEKGLIFESFQSRVYPQSNLYSHIIGQVDYENNGISGVEKFFDNDLRNSRFIDEPLRLSLDTNLQHIIKDELYKSLEIFKAKGAAGVLMNAKNGELLSLVSLPDYNINQRSKISDINFMNKITKGVFELGSVFKTFTIALALDEKEIQPDTLIKNIPKKINCSKFTISDIKEFPENLTVEEILIRSSNIGTLLIARKLGEDRIKSFLSKLNLLDTLDFQIDEVGTPLDFNWEKCKLETIAYGHGITTTPLQAATAYASLTNGGYLIKPTILKKNESVFNEKIISNETSKKLNKILRKVVTDEEGTASLADIDGYSVAGKTGTSKKYRNDKNLNTFISVFPSNNPKFVLLVMLDEPDAAPKLEYNYRGQKIKNIYRNEAGWNAAYVSGKIIKKIGPILAINSKEFNGKYVAKKSR